MILVGDIGGTKTILAIYELPAEGGRCIRKQTYPSADYDTFELLFDDFVSNSGVVEIECVCLGVAGPVVDGQCRTTNLPWLLDQRSLANKLAIDQVWLLNDLEAAAWGILQQTDDQLIEINPDAEAGDDAKKRRGHMAVLAAGTGLGEALIVDDGERYHVVAGEGGHSAFAPNSDQELELLSYMLKKHPGHVSNERLISGEGIVNIYHFLKQSCAVIEDPEFAKCLQDGDPAALIGVAGIGQDNELAVKTVNLFSRLYGGEAANLALKCLPYGGIYLAGGIAAKLLPVLQNGGFVSAFLAAGRYRSILKKMSIKVCLNQECGLEGALNFALDKV